MMFDPTMVNQHLFLAFASQCYCLLARTLLFMPLILLAFIQFITIVFSTGQNSTVKLTGRTFDAQTSRGLWLFVVLPYHHIIFP